MAVASATAFDVLAARRERHQTLTKCACEPVRVVAGHGQPRASGGPVSREGADHDGATRADHGSVPDVRDEHAASAQIVGGLQAVLGLEERGL